MADRLVADGSTEVGRHPRRGSASPKVQHGSSPGRGPSRRSPPFARPGPPPIRCGRALIEVGACALRRIETRRPLVSRRAVRRWLETKRTSRAAPVGAGPRERHV